MIKVATYNIKHASNNARYAEAIGQLIKDEQIDIIGIQEIDMFCKRSGNVDVLDKIAKASGLNYYKFNKTINWENGEYGIGVLSKYPFTTEEVHYLPNCKEQRALVTTTIDLNGLKFKFLVTHLELGTYQDVRRLQFSEIKERVKNFDSFILTGDFNVSDWTKENNFFEFDEYLSEYSIVNNPSNTFMSYSGAECIGNGFLPIDNIILSKDFKVLNTKMVDTDYSDHDILICEIERE